MPSALLTHPRTGLRVQGIDMYALADVDLRNYKGLLIPIHADQRFLLSLRSTLEAFLQTGAKLIVCGHVAYPFLPELAPFVPLTKRSSEDYRVWRVQDHAIFAGVETADLTFRKGVAGFYGRGHNPPPPRARVLHCLGAADGTPVDYLYDRPGGGQVLVHAGNDLWMYVADDTSANRIAPQLLDWIELTAPSGEAREDSRP